MKKLDKYADPNCEECDGTGEIEIDPVGPWDTAHTDYCNCVVDNIERAEKLVDQIEEKIYNDEFLNLIKELAKKVG